MLYIYTKFCENISKGFGSYYANKISMLTFTKGHNSEQNVGGVLFSAFVVVFPFS